VGIKGAIIEVSRGGFGGFFLFFHFSVYLVWRCWLHRHEKGADFLLSE